MSTPHTTSETTAGDRRSATWPAMRGTRRLVGFYFFFSAATLVGAYFLRHYPEWVTPAVWIRGSIVLASSVLTMAFSARASRGSGRGFLRLRIISVIMVVAIVVIIALPGAFPAWLRLEQALCGLLLLGVVWNVNRPRLRALYA